MPVVWEELFTLSATATHSGSGTDVQYDSDTFDDAYLWTTYTVDYSSDVEWGTEYDSSTAWWLTDITNGKKLQVNAAGNSTITVTLVFYGVRLTDEEYGTTSPALLRRVT